jgi:hypothetical protein
MDFSRFYRPLLCLTPLGASLIGRVKEDRTGDLKHVNGSPHKQRLTTYGND